MSFEHEIFYAFVSEQDNPSDSERKRDRTKKEEEETNTITQQYNSNKLNWSTRKAMNAYNQSIK